MDFFYKIRQANDIWSCFLPPCSCCSLQLLLSSSLVESLLLHGLAAAEVHVAFGVLAAPEFLSDAGTLAAAGVIAALRFCIYWILVAAGFLELLGFLLLPRSLRLLASLQFLTPFRCWGPSCCWGPCASDLLAAASVLVAAGILAAAEALAAAGVLQLLNFCSFWRPCSC
jgi:hypothetical protein